MNTKKSSYYNSATTNRFIKAVKEGDFARVRVAEALGCSEGHMSNIMNGKAFLNKKYKDKVKEIFGDKVIRSKKTESKNGPVCPKGSGCKDCFPKDSLYPNSIKIYMSERLMDHIGKDEIKPQEGVLKKVMRRLRLI